MGNLSDDYHQWYEAVKVWKRTKWFGTPMWKLPFDAFIIQDIITEIEPDYIIETGTGHGGSAMFYASLCELMGKGKVITVDIEVKVEFPRKYKFEDRLIPIFGGSTNPLVFDKIKEKAEGKRNIVLLDSWHSYDHVLEEMKMYSDLVPVGSYMIVEDTHVSGHPVEWDYGKGPYEAVEKFMKMKSGFEIDKGREVYRFSFNPNGYLRRKK
jgi:cephalosporin hydroxylase